MRKWAVAHLIIANPLFFCVRVRCYQCNPRVYKNRLELEQRLPC
jgi:hypothetical protein